MRKLLVASVALAALTGATMATAHPQDQYHGGYYQDDDDDDDDWNNGGDTYAEFRAEYQHVAQVIRHAVSDGTMSPYRARRYFRELESIGRAAYYAQQDGDYDGDYAQERLERLHERVDARHARNHGRQDRYLDPHYR